MKLLLDIKDEKASFFMEIIKSFSFVKIEKEEYAAPTKEEIIKNIEQGLKEVELIEEGKLKANSLNEFLNEL